MRGSAAATALTGIALLIFVYYAGGALTTPSQSLWMAVGVGVSVVLLTWLLYDAVWTLLANRPAVAAVVSLLLVGAIAQGLAEFMTGRAVFIHVGATLGTILLNETNQRPQRIVHNAVIAPAALLFMISNHFPLIYGTSRPWLAAPLLVALGCTVGLSLRWLSLRSMPLPTAVAKTACLSTQRAQSSASTSNAPTRSVRRDAAHRIDATVGLRIPQRNAFLRALRLCVETANVSKPCRMQIRARARQESIGAWPRRCAAGRVSAPIRRRRASR